MLNRSPTAHLIASHDHSGTFARLVAGGKSGHRLSVREEDDELGDKPSEAICAPTHLRMCGALALAMLRRPREGRHDAPLTLLEACKLGGRRAR